MAERMTTEEITNQISTHFLASKAAFELDDFELAYIELTHARDLFKYMDRNVPLQLRHELYRLALGCELLTLVLSVKHKKNPAGGQTGEATQKASTTKETA